MPTAPSPSPPFFCPRCGQKHRADLGALRGHPGAVARMRCAGCHLPLAVRLEQGEPRCTEDEASEAPVPEPPPATVLPPGPPLAAGDRVGRYRVKETLAHGESSELYRAFDPTTKRDVALKVLRAGAPAPVRARFLRQVDVQAQMRHPNVLSVFDRGELPDGRPWFTSELLEGARTLDEALTDLASGATAGALESLRDLPTLVSQVFLPVADALYVANVENGVAHADLRPENVVLEGGTLRPFVVDFGRARGIEGGRTPALPTDEAPEPRRDATAYLAPEVVRGTAHPRTDVWGLGAVLYRMVAGRPPLEGTGGDLLAAARDGRVVALGESVPAGLATVLAKALDPVPERRHVNARQLAAEVRVWLRGGESLTRLWLRRGAWAAAGALLGLFLGSRLDLGGGNGSSPRVRETLQAIENLATHVDRDVRPIASRVDPAEAGRVWTEVQAEADRLGARLALEPAGGERDAALARLAWVRARLPAVRLVLEVPDGVPVRVRDLVTGRDTPVEQGRADLAPGLHEVRVGAGGEARFPVLAPLRVVPGGTDPDALPALVRTVPVSPTTLPPGEALVAGGPVRVHDRPVATPTTPETVATFVLDRDEVTVVEYAAFLSSLPAEARAERAPPEGFLLDDAGSPLGPEPGREREPVRGLRPVDAEAYCAWRGNQEGRLVRLPTEAEWVRAALGDPGTPLPDTLDAAPFGVRGLLGGVRELVSTADGGHVLKGARGAGDTVAEALYAAEAVAPDVRRADAGLRCAAEPPAP